MKYEISQGQYRDFLNTLTRDQQHARTQTNLATGIQSVGNRYVMSDNAAMQHRNGIRCDSSIPTSNPLTFYCDFDGDGTANEPTDGEWIACNWMSWADGAAYCDWAGLRPMTELEFEKACRGVTAAVPGVYAWGTTDLATLQYTLGASGESTEGIALNYTSNAGNTSYEVTTLAIGPHRVGIFAAQGGVSRVPAGASHWGNKRSYLRVSDRYYGAFPLTIRFQLYGFRGVR